MNIKTTKTDNPLSFGMAMAGGIGIMLMMVALGIGVTQGETADTGLIGVLFLGGLALLILGVGAWVAVTRPFAHFDDITQPKDAGHGHDAHPAADHPADEHGQAAALPPGGTHG